MDTDMVKAVHDAAVSLGAQCGDWCAFNDTGAIGQPKSYKAATLGRAHALSLLHDLGREI